MGDSDGFARTHQTRRTLAALTMMVGLGSSDAVRTEAPPSTTRESADLSYARGLSRVFREVARRASPSVVAITTTSPHGRGEGTGVILSRDGLIITNNHVIANSRSASVQLADGREFPAMRVGADLETDLAVIRINATGLTPAIFGDSVEIQTGDWVLAIGSPFGLEQTVTAGIVSAKGRDGMGLSQFEEYIQTDAAINPGNSGGPLLDLDGTVVGINCGIASASGSSAGIGFAIPSHVVQRVADALSRGERVRRGWLGVSMRPIQRDGTDRVLITVVGDNAPAAHAGLRVGDVVTTVDGAVAKTPAQIMRAVANHTPNTAIELGVIRDGNPLTISVTLGERPTVGIHTEGAQRPLIRRIL